MTLIENNGYLPVFVAATSLTGPFMDFYENIPGRIFTSIGALPTGSVIFHMIRPPLDINFKKAGVYFFATAGARTLSVGIGIYSLTGSTLTLVNQATGSTDITAATTGWLTLATSATSHISAGSWFIGGLKGVTGNTVGVYGAQSSLGGFVPMENVGLAGTVQYGRLTATTAALPSSAATSDLQTGTGNTNFQLPYVIISS